MKQFLIPSHEISNAASRAALLALLRLCRPPTGRSGTRVDKTKVGRWDVMCPQVSGGGRVSAMLAVQDGCMY